MLESSWRRTGYIVAIVFFMAASTARVLWSDATMPQGFDEPCHIAAGINWLDKHDYSLDSVHPPLSRDAIALPLYLAGQRLPQVERQNTLINGYCTQLGNAILNDRGHYRRNLLLARIGILPFLWTTLILVYWWTKQAFGSVAAGFSVALLSTTPGILAFSGLAYTDMPTACAQFASLYAFYLWLKRPSSPRVLFLGICAGLALSSKLTSGPFLLFSSTAMLVVWCWRSPERTKDIGRFAPVHFAIVCCVALVIVWGFYGFSMGQLQDALKVDSVSTVTEAYGSDGSIVQSIFNMNPTVPAPDLMRGVHLIFSMNKAAPECYLLGRSKPGGWWYFFPVALALKTPIPFMLLALLGCFLCFRKRYVERREALMPGVAILAIFLVTAFVSLRVGTRHVLIVLPLLGVLAGLGASLLWKGNGIRPIVGRVLLGALLSWQLLSTVRAQGDFVAYFNEFAPADRSRALIKGCDLDCGQDLLRLSRELKSLHAGHVNIGVWSSADLAYLDMPPFDILQPYKPVKGWVAVSLRALRTGQVVVCNRGRMIPNGANPPNMLSWLRSYNPVAHIGETILLYYIPENQSQDVDSNTTGVLNGRH